MDIRFNPGEFKKGRIWLDELPSERYITEGEICSTIEANDRTIRIGKRAAAEVFIAPRHFARLGFEYVYKDSANLEIHVNIGKDCGPPVTNTLALPSDPVYSGITNEYAPTILDRSTKEISKNEDIPSGVLTFKLGAHSDYGSNRAIFKKVTRILMKIFLDEEAWEDQQRLAQIVRNEMEGSLLE
ncbi:MAG: hypothetical protein JW817_02910 [Clostridiales bacterium]|nr:hypothetical protein [Clostridiales bacterium]